MRYAWTRQLEENVVGIKKVFSGKEYIGLGSVPIGIGAILRGWDFTETEFRAPHRLPVVDFRAMTGECRHRCFHCFTERGKKTLTLPEIKRVIDEIADLGARSIDFLGEGEPTLDDDYFEILRYTSSKGVIPIVFTDAATRMRKVAFVQRTFDIGATVCPKCDSLFNPGYQNMVVGDSTGAYFEQRNEALELLVKEGFSAVKSDGTTRLGFDMVVSSLNIHEVPMTLEYCRQRNIWVAFSCYLPVGLSAKENFNRNLRPNEKQKHQMRLEILRIDAEFDFNHPVYSNFATGPCVERLQIFGDGRVSPCPGNETVIGNVRDQSIQDLHRTLLKRFPDHNPLAFDGHCLYRRPIGRGYEL
jgi:MoaA/NifB/PqqE/SkfB family radical SAM enzyme